MTLMGDPHESLRVVHVTGTSGKTSTCYAIRALLEASGFRTGLTVSPHITSLTERVQIGGQPIEEDLFCSYAEQMLDILKPIKGELTYFEFMICLAIWIFSNQEVDYAIVEVGIGGLRDATNILRRSDKVSVIGPIGLDHTEKLGNTIAEIAIQKAGIIVDDGVCFVVDQSTEALDVVVSCAQAAHARIIVVPRPPHQDSFASPTPDPRHGIETPEYQRQNWDLAWEATTYLAHRDGFTIPENRDHLMYLTPPARFEWVNLGGRRVLVDGAHSPQKLASLVEAIHAQGLGPFTTLATLTQAPDSKIELSMRTLAPVVSRLIIPEFILGKDDKTKTSVQAQRIADIAKKLSLNYVVVPDLRQAVDTLLEDSSTQLLVTGSLYLAALVRPLLLKAAQVAVI